MRIYTLDRETFAPLPLADTFRFFEDPYNLIRITPPELNLKVTNAERVAMRKGAVIRYTIRVAGVPLKWKTVISGYEPPRCFVDEQISGPYRIWRHRHTLEAVPGGTLVRDHVDYALPFGWLGRLVHRLFVRRRVERIFLYRERVLTELFAGLAAKER